MKRADKIRLAAEAAAAAAADDTRDEAARDVARREWGQVRKAAREAFLAKGDWGAILNAYKDQEGFYTPAERTKMVKDYSDELISITMRESPPMPQRRPHQRR
jgi:hypothetical protein